MKVGEGLCGLKLARVSRTRYDTRIREGVTVLSSLNRIFQ